MRAMILAAGRGERMRPLTDTVPKPLLPAGGKPLIAWHIERLVAAGITDIVVNHAWLGEKLQAALGDGGGYGARLRYSPEQTALETAGGIAQALPLLGSDPFLVINGDIWCDWQPGQSPGLAAQLDGNATQAWLLLAANPPHHPEGDFHLNKEGRVTPATGDRLTFSGIGVYHPALFEHIVRGTRAPLGPLLRQAIAQGSVRGARHEGAWIDVGTPQRLAELDAVLSTAR